MGVFACFISQLPRGIVFKRSADGAVRKYENGGKSRDVPMGETWRFDMVALSIDFLQSVPP
jgi:hypothetical protein